jgi:hypothetical protein
MGQNLAPAWRFARQKVIFSRKKTLFSYKSENLEAAGAFSP